MSRVLFNDQTAAPVVNTGRADVACFIGLVRLQPSAMASAGVANWLRGMGYSAAQIASLTGVPLPVENYSSFLVLFDDGSYGGGFGTDYTAACVRSFFAQGGKRCYVVRLDDPLTRQDSFVDTDPATPTGKIIKLNKFLLPTQYTPQDASTWKGIGALTALEEVSYVATPDLSALTASEPVGSVGQVPVVPAGPQEFTPCTPAVMVPQQQRSFITPAPRLALSDYALWASCVASVLNYLTSGSLTNLLHLREMQYITAFPMPQELDTAAAAENPSSSEIAKDLHTVVSQYLPETLLGPVVPNVGAINLSSSFLQLAYPWLRTSGSKTLLEQLEPPEGALAGLIARNALTRGAFTSATKITPSEIYDVQPALPASELKSSAVALQWGPTTPQKAMIERVSLFGFAPSGLRLLSDVTAYPGESYRAGATSRLMDVICRAARRIGESNVFQNNGPNTWRQIERGLQNLLTRAWTLGALDGASASEAFSVRCDRSTMTQNDLDNGRLIATVTFTAAALVETITVKLAIEASGTSAQAIAANVANSAVIPSSGDGSQVGVN